MADNYAGVYDATRNIIMHMYTYRVIINTSCDIYCKTNLLTNLHPRLCAGIRAAMEVTKDGKKNASPGFVRYSVRTMNVSGSKFKQIPRNILRLLH